ncbi:PREDICTED: guanine nucleotide exchange factor for Rab-3A isoform X3 [Chinchilla lanigera]|nr:PREDICTED: guanine nucleotide exchange factor for Rab-3A isoform X3 [Chinchilla lanigera]XP_013361883.1 PREDICTED: guanine nucleotide exchange factor for Rab-3A isoform X3 [Chinchilla lanigera]
MEIREKGSEFLREELQRAQKELRLKDAECARLCRVREQLERELEELTASLFEEAHKMVREANVKQAASEKQLKEARGKIDMLQAEVTALKTLVITSTPASPNRELHPQLLSPTKAGLRKGHARHKSTSSALCPAMCPTTGQGLAQDKEGREPGLAPLLSLLLCALPSKAAHLTYEPAWPPPPGEPAPAAAACLSFARQVTAWRGHPRAPLHAGHSPASLVSPARPPRRGLGPGQALRLGLGPLGTEEPNTQQRSLLLPGCGCRLLLGSAPATRTRWVPDFPPPRCPQVDTTLFAEFQAWRAAPTLDKACPFLDRVYREDVGPCLDFTMRELSVLVRGAVEDNTLTIEPVASHAQPSARAAAVECGRPSTCALSGLTSPCRHRIRLGDSESHYYISPSSRARITAVCNFFTYIRYIQQGLVRQDVEPMFWEVMRLRKEMSLAKLGFCPQEA